MSPSSAATLARFRSYELSFSLTAKTSGLTACEPLACLNAANSRSLNAADT